MNAGIEEVLRAVIGAGVRLVGMYEARVAGGLCKWSQALRDSAE
jgi:hypothetical protein